MTTNELADRFAIRELTAAYNNTIDGGDVAGFARTFTATGEFVVPGGLEEPLRGTDQIEGFARAIGYGCIHMTTDAVISVDGDRAQQHCSLIVLRREREGRTVEVITTGRYDDELVRTPDGWRFARRTIETDVALDTVLQLFGAATSA